MERLKKLLLAAVSFLVIAALNSTSFAKVHKKKQRVSAGDTRALYPYLKYRNYVKYNDGSSDRVRSVAWHPTESVFALGGGPRSNYEQLALYRVSGNSTGARADCFNSLDVEPGSHDTSYQVNALSWSPDGSYLAAASEGTATEQFRVYSYVNSALAELVTLNWNTSTTGKVKTIAWHPSGNYVAIGGIGQTNSYSFLVYSFDGITPQLVALVGAKLGTGTTVHSLAWDATGTYLAVGCGGESTGTAALQVYSFSFSSGYSLTQISTKDFGGSTAYAKAVAWSPDNNYLAVGGYAGTSGTYEVRMYTVPAGVLTATSDAVIDFGTQNSSDYEGVHVDTLAWDPEGEYLLVGGYDKIYDHQMIMYKFSDGLLTPKVGAQLKYGEGPGTYVSTVGWSPSRKYVVIGGYAPGITYGSTIRLNKEIWLMEFVTSKP